jgi:hypothetical protein
MRKVFESRQASFRNQTAAGIGLNLHKTTRDEEDDKTYEYDAEGHRREE